MLGIVAGESAGGVVACVAGCSQHKDQGSMKHQHESREEGMNSRRWEVGYLKEKFSI